MGSEKDLIQKAIAADEAVDQAREQVARAVDRRASALREAHDSAITWVALGEALGVTAARAQQASRPRTDQTERRRK